MSLRLSPTSLIYINLALGLFVAVANGMALFLVVSGREEKLSGQGLEIGAWSIAGVLLAASAGYALHRVDRLAEILRWQAYLVITLIVALTAWALTLLTGATASSARVVWAVGYLSVLALYSAVLASHAFADPRYSRVRAVITWVLVPVCVAVDILTYLKITE